MEGGRDGRNNGDRGRKSERIKWTRWKIAGFLTAMEMADVTAPA